jgi:hypothetical protein
VGSHLPFLDGTYILTIDGGEIRDVYGRPVDRDDDGIPGIDGTKDFRIVGGRLKRS